MRLPLLTDRPGMTADIGAVRANPGAFDSGAVEAFGQVQAGGANLAARQKAQRDQAQEAADAVTAQKVVSQAKLDWHKKLMDAQSAAPEGAAGFTDGLTKSLDSDVEGYLAKVPDSAKTWAEGQLDDLKDDRTLDAINFEHKAGQVKQLTDLDDIANLNANGVRQDFGTLGDATARTLGAINASNLSADNKRTAAATARERLAIAAVEGQVERDPSAAKKTLARDDFKAVLSPKNYDALLGSADLEIKRRQDDVERKAREAEQDHRAYVADLREQARFQIAAAGSGTIPAGYDDTVKQLQAAGDNKTATTMQLVKGDVSWTNQVKRMSPQDLQAELDKTRAQLAKETDPVIAADLAGRLDQGETILKYSRGLQDAQAKQIAGDIQDQQSDIRGQAQLAIAAYQAGQPFAGMDALIQKAQQFDKPTADVLRQVRAGQADEELMKRMSPDQVTAHLKDLGDQATKSASAQWAATLAIRIKHGEQIHDAMVQGLAKDPLAFAESTGVVQQTDLYGALSAAATSGDASPLPAALQARQQANARVKSVYGVQPALLRPDEAKAYVQAFGQAPSADAKTALLTPIAALPEATVTAIAGQLAGQPGGDRITGVLSIMMDGDTATAHDILAGAETGKNVKGSKPEDNADLRGELRDGLGNLLIGNPQARGAIEQSAIDLYAKLSADAGDNSGVLDADRMQEAIHRVTGGVVTFHQVQVLPPKAGMSDAAFADLVGTIDAGYLKSQSGDGKSLPAYATGAPVSADDVRRLGAFQSAGNGTYALYVNGAPVRDPATGGAFIVDLRKLMPNGASGAGAQ
jgi:hypothetical protein